VALGLPEVEESAHDIAAAPETAAERDRLKEINGELLTACKMAYGLIFRYSLILKEEHGTDLGRICAAIARAERRAE
jgi:hypothetical protein